MKIAVIGLNPNTLGEIPWDDDSWEKWGMAWDGGRTIYRCDKLFEIHDEETWHNYIERTGEYKRVMADTGAGLVFQWNFPLKEAIETFGDYFQFSFSYMMAAAIMKEPDEIMVCGFSPDGDYADQRANMEYFIGFARGRGIKVTIAAGANLCQYKPSDAYPVRYGFIR